ncbi:MAG TPA: GNAT family N-acetyltransferase [Steroidobacteraceae bacterium]|jgi:RimJ/RimL family protein N-acetyltransferase|nr:GNAT family N-acetyltransferase [Steroidobacteraceae bacterium]
MPVNTDFDASLQRSPVGSHTLLLQTRYPVVATSRLRLRPCSLLDISSLISAVAAHRIAAASLSVPRPFDARQAQYWIESHPLEWRKRCAVHWAVSALDNDRFCGYVGLQGIELATGHANLSVWIADRLARKELAFEAAQAALAFAFTSLQLQTVHARVSRANPMMARVLRRIGMKSDTATLQTQPRGATAQVLRWHMSRGTWATSRQDPPAH